MMFRGRGAAEWLAARLKPQDNARRATNGLDEFTTMSIKRSDQFAGWLDLCAVSMIAISFRRPAAF